MKHNIILKALRCLAAAGLCLAVAACSKDDIMPVEPPQEGITPTQIIFNATRGGYEGDAETRAPKSEWAEGDVVYFGNATKYSVGENGRGKATYTNGEWVVTITDRFIRNSVTLYGRYAEKATARGYDNLYMEQPGELACTTSGSYEVGENGITTITLTLDEHPQGRMTFTGVEPGKELTVLGMKYAYEFPSTWLRPWFKTAPLTLTGEADGTATLYALPNIVTEGSTTLTVEYDGTLYTKTFAGKEFKENSNITLAAPSLEGGWAEAVTEYAAADLKMGDYLYSDGTTSDGGLRKLYPDGTVETAPGAVAPEAGKTVIGIVFHAGRHATDASDYTSPLTAGGPTLASEMRGYAVAITDAHNNYNDMPCWANKTIPLGLKDTYSSNEYDWNGYANCQAMHNCVKDYADKGWEMRHFQAAWACENYGNRALDYDGNPTDDYAWQAPLKAPTGTSGWFLPSCGQLLHMLTYKDYLESQFSAVKATADAGLQEHIKQFDNNYDYISSTIHDGWITQAWTVNFIQGKRNQEQSYKDYVRPVIVF